MASTWCPFFLGEGVRFEPAGRRARPKTATACTESTPASDPRTTAAGAPPVMSGWSNSPKRGMHVPWRERAEGGLCTRRPRARARTGRRFPRRTYLGVSALAADRGRGWGGEDGALERGALVSAEAWLPDARRSTGGDRGCIVVCRSRRPARLRAGDDPAASAGAAAPALEIALLLRPADAAPDRRALATGLLNALRVLATQFAVGRRGRRRAVARLVLGRHPRVRGPPPRERARGLLVVAAARRRIRVA